MIVNKIWRLGDKSTLIDVFVVNDTTVKFRVRNEAMRRRVLNRGMWNIMNVPMLISKWTPFAEEAQPAMKSIPLWVTLKNVPPSMFTDKGLDFLASGVGKPKRLHPKTEACESFETAQILVEADLTKELPHEYDLRGEEEGELDVKITYSYPWLPPRCSSCKKWGHGTDACLATDRETQKPQDSPTINPKKIQDSDLVSIGDIVGESHKKEEQREGVEDDSHKSEGWITPQKSNRSPAKKTEGLQYGEVSILSNSYSVLNGKGEKGEDNIEAGKNETEEENVTKVAETQENVELQSENAEKVIQDHTTSKDELPLRHSLPRGSKDAHKFVSNTSTKPARVNHRAPSKKTSKNH